MTLTRRRLQFLQKLVDLYHKTNLPIHYEALANAIGVSKWTAYDVLKEIEKQGFVARRYDNNAKETGRSQVVFVPTSKASELLRQPDAESFDFADWNRTVANIFGMLKESRHVGLNEALRRMIDEMSAVNGRLHFCAYMMGLLVCLKTFGGKTESWIRQLVQRAPNKEAGMTMFAGTVLGTSIQKVNEELGLEITELVSRFLKSVTHLSGEEKDRLFDFWREAY